MCRSGTKELFVFKRANGTYIQWAPNPSTGFVIGSRVMLNCWLLLTNNQPLGANKHNRQCNIVLVFFKIDLFGSDEAECALSFICINGHASDGF